MPTVSADDIVGFAPGTRGRTISPDDIVGLGEIPTYAPQTVTDDDIVPTPQELSTLEAPEGSPQREDINKGVAGNLFAPPGIFAREPTLAELVNSALPRSVQESQRDEGRIPLAPPLPEQGRFEQGGVLGVLGPGLEAGETVARGLAPRTDSWGHLITDLGSFATPPVGSVQELIDAPENARKNYANMRAQMEGKSLSELPFPEQLDPVTAAQQMPEGPEKQQALLNAGVNVVAQMIMAKGIAHGIARPEPSHLRTEPLVPEPPPTQNMGPGTIAGDVSRALERRFTLQEPPPEAPPELAPAPPIEETLPKIGAPPFNPEAGLGMQPEFPMPLRSEEFAQTEGARPIPPGQVLKNRTKLLAKQAELKQRFIAGDHGVAPELEAVEAQINDPVTNPVVHAPVEQRVQHGEFAKPGYTAVDTPPEGPVTPQVVSSESPIWESAPKAAAQLPPPAQGTVRLYHGGTMEGAGRDFTTSLDYATGYAAKSGEGATVWHVDVPADSPWLKYDESIGRPLNAQIVPDEIANQARPLTERPVNAPGGATVAPEAPGGVPVAETAAEPYTQEAAAQRAAQALKPPVQTDLPESGFSTERAQAIYGDDAVLITRGKSASAWKEIGQADKRNPYDVLEKARARKIATPDEAANLRAEHQRLLERARQAHGTPEYDELANNAVDFLNASKEVVHGPASDLFRGLQEADRPTYMSPADYDNILRERQMQATPDETATFTKVADEMRNGDKQAREAAANGQEALKKYRPHEVVPFDEAADFVKKQIEDLTKPCAL